MDYHIQWPAIPISAGRHKSGRGIIQRFSRNLEYVDKRGRKISLMPSAGIRSSGKDVDVKVQIAGEFKSLNPDWIRFPKQL